MKKISRAGFTKTLNKPLTVKQLIADLEDFTSKADHGLAPNLTKLIDESKFHEIIEIFGPRETSILLSDYYKQCIVRLDALSTPRDDTESQEHYLRERHTLRGASALLGARLCGLLIGPT